MTDQAPPASTPKNDSDARVIENKPPWWTQWPMFLLLVLIWCALWQDFRIGQIIMGAITAVLVMFIFRLPPIPFGDRFNFYYAVKFLFIFLWKITWASIDVGIKAIVRGPRITNSVLAVQLRSHDDLVVTLVAHAYALIPGSLVIDVDRTTSTLYLHVLDVPNDQAAEDYKRDSRNIESHIIRAIGSKKDYALIRGEHEASERAPDQTQHRGGER
ncbi:Na+/H+ antiporter subunit E [Auritidibacter sp. NML100628]|uniref:Na+/H+ antiporter subunit E n=1 Tax=Auritidibacter sp. NML100628 TaxID=2170742 RepID=UPI000D72A6FF|nr:Na+/H+ antiporter subunit E [Auritidibacter sp. NML100628]PXA78305.1 Na+/H+ antiporter subunit E [Auritidibacter sp. NML100628]